MREVRTSRTLVRSYSPVAFSLIWGTYNTVKPPLYGHQRRRVTYLFIKSILRFMENLRKIWILQTNWTIRRHNNAKLRHCVNQFMPRGWKWWANYSDCVTLVAVLCERFFTTSPRTAGRRKQKPAWCEWIRRTVSSLISPTLIVMYTLCLQSAFCCVLPFS